MAASVSRSVRFTPRGRILSHVGTQRTALEGIAFERLISRAASQEQTVERHRLSIGRFAFCSLEDRAPSGDQTTSHRGPAVASPEVQRMGATDKHGCDLENPT